MQTFIDGDLVDAEDCWNGEPVQIDAEGVRHPDLLRLYSLWDKKRGSRRFPGPGEMSPRDMLYMLNRIALIEVQRDPLRFYWRVVGGWWRDNFGVEGTGMYVDQWPSKIQRDMLLESYGTIAATEAPCRHVRNQFIDGQILLYEALLLPIGVNDEFSMSIVGAPLNANSRWLTYCASTTARPTE